MAQCIDKVLANNSKLRYECTWSHTSDGRSACVFAIDVDDWTRLASDTGFSKRTCVGLYQVDTPIPESAARATNILLPKDLAFPDDAFAD